MMDTLRVHHDSLDPFYFDADLAPRCRRRGAANLAGAEGTQKALSEGLVESFQQIII